MIGKILLHYEIISKIGEGGMGVVYKAKDSHLDRFVAIKVLPNKSIEDPTRKARFVQEAKAASALNHPNIITIHDICQQDGVDFIVMEYIAGKTLHQIIPHKGLKVGDALKYSVQITDALSRAHGAGIIHRDLKPSNIMVDERGQVKVVDFGLAKLAETAPLDEDESTLSIKPTTEKGNILGTVFYMSPEQAEGRPVDARSDIFSFGSVLHEMVTGKRAFQKNSTVSTLAAIIHEDPEPLGAEVPREISRIITRCLRKDPDRRFQLMKDLKVELTDLREESDSGKLQSISENERKHSWHWLWAAGPAVALLLSVMLVWQYREASPPGNLKPVVLTSYPGAEGDVSFSPDGSKVAFTWNGEKGDNYDIYIKQISSAETPPMRLTTNPSADIFPAWSPDDSWIAFVRREPRTDNSAIMLISPLGGPERRIAGISAGYNLTLSWTPDAKWLAYCTQDSPGEPNSIWAISVETGERRRLTSFVTRNIGAGNAVLGDYGPSISPNGRILAFARESAIDIYELYTLQLTKDMRPDGEPAKVSDRQYNMLAGIAWTHNSREIVYAAGDGIMLSLWRVSSSGNGIPERQQFAQSAVLFPAVARTLPRLAYSWMVFNVNLWRLDTHTNKRTMVSGSTYGSFYPAYSPDGGKIAFFSNRSGVLELWTCHADGTHPMQLTRLDSSGKKPQWSPDGRWLAFETSVKGPGEIYVIAADGGGWARNITHNPAQDINPSWSRDGKWIYFASDRSGRFEIWKMPKDGGETTQVTSSGGYRAHESWDGRHVYFIKSPTRSPSEATLFEMPAEGGPEIQILKGIGEEAFSVTAKGICFFAPHGKEIRQLDPGTGKVRTLAALDRQSYGGLTVSSDGAYVVWDQVDQYTVDLMLVENFR
jgi:serine/threonine protein kinase